MATASVIEVDGVFLPIICGRWTGHAFANLGSALGFLRDAMCGGAM